jgi:hypothetical protein
MHLNVDHRTCSPQQDLLLSVIDDSGSGEEPTEQLTTSYLFVNVATKMTIVDGGEGVSDEDSAQTETLTTSNPVLSVDPKWIAIDGSGESGSDEDPNDTGSHTTLGHMLSEVADFVLIDGSGEEGSDDNPVDRVSLSTFGHTMNLITASAATGEGTLYDTSDEISPEDIGQGLPIPPSTPQSSTQNDEQHDAENEYLQTVIGDEHFEPPVTTFKHEDTEGTSTMSPTSNIELDDKPGDHVSKIVTKRGTFRSKETDESHFIVSTTDDRTVGETYDSTNKIHSGEEAILSLSNEETNEPHFTTPMEYQIATDETASTSNFERRDKETTRPDPKKETEEPYFPPLTTGKSIGVEATEPTMVEGDEEELRSESTVETDEQHITTTMTDDSIVADETKSTVTFHSDEETTRSLFAEEPIRLHFTTAATDKPTAAENTGSMWNMIQEDVEDVLQPVRPEQPTEETDESYSKTPATGDPHVEEETKTSSTIPDGDGEQATHSEPYEETEEPHYSAPAAIDPIILEETKSTSNSLGVEGTSPSESSEETDEPHVTTPTTYDSAVAENEISTKDDGKNSLFITVDHIESNKSFATVHWSTAGDTTKISVRKCVPNAVAVFVADIFGARITWRTRNKARRKEYTTRAVGGGQYARGGRRWTRSFQCVYGVDDGVGRQ